MGIAKIPLDRNPGKMPGFEYKFCVSKHAYHKILTPHFFQPSDASGIVRTIYNPNVHNDRAEDRYIGATVKYFDIPLSLALNYLYYSLEIVQVDSRISSLTYFQIYSLDEVIEMPISSDGSYINV